MDSKFELRPTRITPKGFWIRTLCIADCISDAAQRCSKFNCSHQMCKHLVIPFFTVSPKNTKQATAAHLQDLSLQLVSRALRWVLEKSRRPL